MQVRCSVRVWRDRGKYISAAFLFYLWICAYCAEFQLSLIVFLFTRSENFARKCISVGKQTVPGLEDQPFWSDPKRLLKWECVVIAFRISLVSLVLPCLNLRCQAYWKLYIFCCAYFFSASYNCRKAEQVQEVIDQSISSVASKCSFYQFVFTNSTFNYACKVNWYSSSQCCEFQLSKRRQGEDF